MSEEGEIKKRISLADGETKRWGKGYRTFIAKDTVDLILDEARQDIMPGEEFWFDWAKTSQENDSQIVKDYKNMLLRFLNWFGEPHEKQT